MNPLSRPSSSRAGFTLVELMIASVIGALVLLVLYQVLFLNQRSFTVQSEQIRQRQTLRASLDVLVSHLSGVSGEGGDLVAGGVDSIRFRTTEAFGVACAGTPTGLRIERYGRRVQPGDSILVLAENRIADPLDDQWLTVRVARTDTVAMCPNTSEAYDLELPGIRIGSAVRVGAPVRAFRHRTFKLGARGPDWFLSWSAGARLEPLVGPLAGPGDGGLAFEYLDSLNVAVADPRTADQIMITVRTASNVLGQDRVPMGDSATARVSLRR